MKTTFAFLLFWIVASGAWAHRDRRLTLSPDGTVPELPAAYSATRLQIQFAEHDSGKLTKLILSSAGQRTVVKDCALKLVRAGSLDRLSLAGSWHHDEKLLPHYIHILFKEQVAAANLPEEPGVVFLFSLRDARLLEVKKIVPLSQGQAVTYQEVELKNGCPSL
jgi:hypothetical protein